MIYIVLEMGWILQQVGSSWILLQVGDHGLLPSDHTCRFSACIRTECSPCSSYLLICFRHFSPLDLNVLKCHLIVCFQSSFKNTQIINGSLPFKELLCCESMILVSRLLLKTSLYVVFYLLEF